MISSVDIIRLFDMVEQDYIHGRYVGRWRVFTRDNEYYCMELRESGVDDTNKIYLNYHSGDNIWLTYHYNGCLVYSYCFDDIDDLYMFIGGLMGVDDRYGAVRLLNNYKVEKALAGLD